MHSLFSFGSTLLTEVQMRICFQKQMKVRFLTFEA
jgi:hypothetical protein